VTNRMALIVAVVLGILSIVGIKAYVDQIRNTQRYTQELMPVLVAARDIEPDQVFTEDDLQIKQFPRQVIEDALRGSWVKEKERDAILGGRTRTKIKTGQVLLRSHFYQRKSRQTLEFKADERAFSVKISKIGGLSGMLKPGDYVDIFAYLEMTDKEGGGEKVQHTRILLPNVLILATNRNTSPYVANNAYTRLTLRLKPAECSKVLLAVARGAQLHCALRREGANNSGSLYPTVPALLWRDVSDELLEALKGR